jgi:bifunctional non-homologous end joining protein LigD
MRLTRIAKAFDDPDYLFELKHDGFRAIAYIEAGECKLVSRNLKHFKSFDHLKKSLDKLPVQNVSWTVKSSASIATALANSTN